MKKFALGLLLLNMFTLFAQEESFPCENSNPELKKLFATGSLDELYVHACYGIGMTALSTSYLKASGKAPAIIGDGSDGAVDSYDYDLWSCMYSPGMLQDGDPKTAWVEGLSSYGEDEIIVVPCLDLQKPVEIWAGFGKSESLFEYNSRPKRINVVIVEARNPDPTQYGTVYRQLKIVAKKEVELRSINGYQTLSVPAFKVNSYYSERFEANEDADYFLAIQIIDVYPGSKWKDTCISELRNKQ